MAWETLSCEVAVVALEIYSILFFNMLHINIVPAAVLTKNLIDVFLFNYLDGYVKQMTHAYYEGIWSSHSYVCILCE